jgi:hypothetical protein
MRGIVGLIVVACLAAGPPGSEPQTVRVPIGEAGDVDVGEVIVRLAERAGLAIARPDAGLSLPMTGLAGALTRTFLAEALGPEVVVEVRPRELVVTLPADRLAPARLAARLDALAARARTEARRDSRYGMRALASYRPNDPTRPTLCLVHGLNSSSRVFVHMIPPLEAAGFGLVVYDFPFNRDLDRSAPAFRRDWGEFRRQQGETRPWAIVAHSLGGLLARSYVEGDDYADDVSDLILIAPPNQGSAVARTQTLWQLIQGTRSVRQGRDGAPAGLGDGLGEAAEDMMPGAAFLRALNARPRRAGVRYHILAGDSGWLTREARRRVEAQFQSMDRPGGLLGGLARLALGDLREPLDAVTDGTGDGCVAVRATRLEGVADHRTIHANHVELIRGPLLYPDPGPVACLPTVLEWLGVPEDRVAPRPRP